MPGVKPVDRLTDSELRSEYARLRGGGNLSPDDRCRLKAITDRIRWLATG